MPFTVRFRWLWHVPHVFLILRSALAQSTWLFLDVRLMWKRLKDNEHLCVSDRTFFQVVARDLILFVFICYIYKVVCFLNKRQFCSGSEKVHGLIQEAETPWETQKDAHVNEHSTQVLKLFDFAAAHELDLKFLNSCVAAELLFRLRKKVERNPQSAVLVPRMTKACRAVRSTRQWSQTWQLDTASWSGLRQLHTWPSEGKVVQRALKVTRILKWIWTFSATHNTIQYHAIV